MSALKNNCVRLSDLVNCIDQKQMKPCIKFRGSFTFLTYMRFNHPSQSQSISIAPSLIWKYLTMHSIKRIMVYTLANCLHRADPYIFYFVTLIALYACNCVVQLFERSMLSIWSGVVILRTYGILLGTNMLAYNFRRNKFGESFGGVDSVTYIGRTTYCIVQPNRHFHLLILAL